MKLIFLVLAGFLTACATSTPKPGNSSGLEIQVVNAKNHSSGLDVTLSLNNTTNNTMRLAPQGPVSVWLNDSDAIRGQVVGTVNIEPGERKKAKLQFEFINMHRSYKSRIVEIYPLKVFKTCTAADADPTVARDNGREVAGEIQAYTCDRALIESIRIAF